MSVDYFCKPQKDVSKLNIEQVRRLRNHRYFAAQSLGITKYLISLPKLLGTNGRFDDGNVTAIWFSEEADRGYVEITESDRLVFSSRLGDRLIIPGYWLGVLLRHRQALEEKLLQKEQIRRNLQSKQVLAFV